MSVAGIFYSFNEVVMFFNGMFNRIGVTELIANLFRVNYDNANGFVAGVYFSFCFFVLLDQARHVTN